MTDTKPTAAEIKAAGQAARTFAKTFRTFYEHSVSIETLGNAEELIEAQKAETQKASDDMSVVRGQLTKVKSDLVTAQATLDGKNGEIAERTKAATVEAERIVSEANRLAAEKADAASQKYRDAEKDFQATQRGYQSDLDTLTSDIATATKELDDTRKKIAALKAKLG